jgi:hypothetical protein
MARKKVIDEISEQLDALGRQLDSVYTALVIRDPGTAVSADAFEGLRRQIIAGAQERMAHLVQLAEMDVALRSGADSSTLLRLVESWIRQSGVDVIEVPTDDLRFEPITGDGPWEVVLPAYVDSATGRTIRQGRLAVAFTPEVSTPVESEPDIDVHGTTSSESEQSSPSEKEEES